MNKIYEGLQLELAALVRYITSLSPPQTGSGLDRSGFLILQYIDSEGMAGTKELADYFKLDISTMSRQVRKLEQKDYLIRQPNPTDKRAQFLTVTAAGQIQLDQYRDRKTKRLKELFGNWDTADLQEFTRLLDKANNDLRENN